MASGLRGAREYRAALRDAPEALRGRIVRALRETVTGVHARGLANIEQMIVRRTGLLKNSYRRSVAPRSMTGRVGYLSAAARQAAFYARFLHDGTRHISARPFHANAVQAEAELDQKRMIEARDDVLAVLGGRRLRP